MGINIPMIFILFVTLFFMQGCAKGSIPITMTTGQPSNAIFTEAAATVAAQLTEAAKISPPYTPFPINPGWLINTSASNFAIIILDYQTLTLKSAYFNILPACRNFEKPVDDEILKSQSSNFFKAVMPYIPQRVITTGSVEKTEIAIDLQNVGDFALLEMEPGDIGGAAVIDRCTALVIFAGSIVWSGKGGQLYPATPIRSDALQYQKGQIAQPQRIDVRAGPYSPGTEGYEAAWNSIQTLNLVQDFASSPYSAFVYLYPRTVGEFSPQNAYWIIFLHRGPSE